MGALRITGIMSHPKRILIMPPIPSERVWIRKASSELGHRDLRTIKKFYDHSAICNEEFLETLPDVTEGS